VCGQPLAARPVDFDQFDPARVPTSGRRRRPLPKRGGRPRAPACTWPLWSPHAQSRRYSLWPVAYSTCPSRLPQCCKPPPRGRGFGARAAPAATAGAAPPARRRRAGARASPRPPAHPFGPAAGRAPATAARAPAARAPPSAARRPLHLLRTHGKGGPPLPRNRHRQPTAAPCAGAPCSARGDRHLPLERPPLANPPPKAGLHPMCQSLASPVRAHSWPLLCSSPSGCSGNPSGARTSPAARPPAAAGRECRRGARP
jgi:hypothetical protein